MIDMIYRLAAQEKFQIKEEIRNISIALHSWSEPQTENDIDEIMNPVIDYISQKLQEAFDEGIKKGREHRLTDADIVGLFANIVIDRLPEAAVEQLMAKI